MRWLFSLLVVAAALFLFCSFILAKEEPPLTVNVVVDPLLRNYFKSDDELIAHISEIINRASLIFNAEVGRRLMLKIVEIELPPDTGLTIDDKAVFRWLGKKLKRHPAHFWVFVTYRPLASCGIPGIWSGCSVMNDPRSIVVYSSDMEIIVNNLLHEFGHNCGAGHSNSQDSIMHEYSRDSTTYGDMLEIVRRNCG